MPKPFMTLPPKDFDELQHGISQTVEEGGRIRERLARFSKQSQFTTEWEVEAAVGALHVFGSRWTIEILSMLYIAGPRRFNEMKILLTGISSRTLSDKLRFLSEEGLVIRVVNDGPPVKVSYELSPHGITCGRLLSPLVAHLKIVAGSVQRQ